MIRRTGLAKGGVVTEVLLITMLCLSLEQTSCQESPSLIDYAPKSGPISGGTRIQVRGDGFLTTGTVRSKCSFELAGRGNAISSENLIHNQTLLTCVQPIIAFLTDSQLQGGNRNTRLAITGGGTGIVSNSVEFFLYDLGRIRVWSISPTEGLVNATNITLSIQGENFLDTNELTCSVGGFYKVSARYINSSFLLCQLAPYPETAQVTINVSMNGQSVANIAPLMNNSTTFIYFASPPQILSCLFTASFAQVVLSFDREVEIGPERRSASTDNSSPLSCGDIFMRDTLESIIGLDSTCFWHNTLQRQVVVQLAADNRVELGSIVSIQSDTIRTRYVEYSRLASGSVEVSLPDTNSPQFSPLAVIEAPSIIPSCGNYTVSGDKSQYGGSRGLEYKWTIGTTYDENGTLIQDITLSEYIPTGFTSQSILELSSDLFQPDLFSSGSGSAPIVMENFYNIELTVRNFLGYTSVARVSNISIAETAQPSLFIVGGDERKIRVSDETILEARLIFHDGCLMQNQLETATYMWRVVDPFNRDVDLDDTPRSSSVLIVQPYSLEVGFEYTAKLSVEFNAYSVVINASTRLVTDISLFDLKANIGGGIRRSVGASEVIELDGRTSQYVNTSSALLEVMWRCIDTETGENCITRNGQTVSFSRDGLVQMIPSRTLTPGEYNFTLTLNLISPSQDSQPLEASVDQIIVIFPYSVPTVKITPDPGMDLLSVLVHKELILNVAVKSDFPGIAEWTSEYIIGYAQVNFSDVNTVRTPVRYNITSTVNSQGNIHYSETMPVLFSAESDGVPSSFVNQVTLIITANSLLPQNAYRLKFSVVDALDNAGFAEVDFYTESTPTSGRLSIDPQNGTPLTTVFSLSANGWTDDLGDTPLLYQFGVLYVFFSSSLSSNTTLPPCCNLLYDNNPSLMDEFKNVSCLCEFMSTGVSEQTELLTTLPILPQGYTGGVDIQVHQLLRVFDRNGAVTEETLSLDGFSTTEQPSDGDDSTQPLQPLSEYQREKVDVLAVLDGIRELSRSSWREALAQLTTLVSFTEVSSFIGSSYINLTLAEIVQFQVKATELVLDIYESPIPVTMSYLNVIADILHTTTSSPGIHGMSSSEMLISRVMDFLQVLVDTFNTFDEQRVFLSPGFSTTEGKVVLEIFQHLINTSRPLNPSTIVQIRENLVTQAFLSLIPKLGVGLCMREKYSFIDGAGKSFIKASRTNLPIEYRSTEECNTRLSNNSKKAKFCSNENVPKVAVNFSLPLFERYLWWRCGVADERDDEEIVEDSYCSGVCLTSAQHTQDLLWQGSPYESQLKSVLFQLYVINPHNGSILEIHPSGMESQTRMMRNVESESEQLDITFPILIIFSNATNLQCVYWNRTSKLWIGQPGFSGEVIERNGTVTGKVCHFSTSLGSTFTVLERCPDGHYGETCLAVCPEGLWGVECRQSCDCNNRGDCSPVDGSCDCNPGWQGDNCEMKCLSGVWGKNCLEQCLCDNGAECDHVTGFCTCTPGWIGTFCNISCSDGFYGNDCREVCACNAVEECNKITGLCDCNIGFTGPTCHEMCPDGFYGEDCALECECFVSGTQSCHHISGSCVCFAEWTGSLCNVEVTPPPEPAFQIWPIVVGIVAVIISAVAVICAIIIIIVCVRVKKRKKILPIADNETGDHVSHHKEADDEVATNSSGSDLRIDITRATSLEVLVPKGKELRDIFLGSTLNKSGGDEEDDSEFKEPLEHEGKLRWQVIRLMPTKSRSPTRYEGACDTPTDSTRDQPERSKDTTVDSSNLVDEHDEEQGEKEGDADSSLEVSKITEQNSRSKYSDESRTESEDDHMTEIVYKRGVYLVPDATLKDLRNSFIEQEKFELNERYFHLLKSNVPGDVIEIDTEDEVLLSQIEHTMVQSRTMYIENIDPGTVTMELCVCGKFADLECGECGRRGYCSMECQQDDWFKHAMVCQKNRAEERRKRRNSSKSRKKKKKHKKHKKHKRTKSRESQKSRESMESRESRVSREFTPSVEVCICGKEAEFECSRCEKQGYCSEECQRKDWEVHLAFCEDSDTKKLLDEEYEIIVEDRSRKTTAVNEHASLNNRISLETLVEETEESEGET